MKQRKSISSVISAAGCSPDAVFFAAGSKDPRGITWEGKQNGFASSVLVTVRLNGADTTAPFANEPSSDLLVGLLRLMCGLWGGSRGG